VFKFNSVIETKQPKLWEELKPNWEEKFSSAAVNINVDLHIRGSAVASKPIRENKE
jgi:spore germination protein KC